MATISEALVVAIQHHQAGRRQAAERIYRQILEVDPQQADAVHLLGVMAHETGQHEIAIEYIGRAISLKGTAGVFHVNLGNAFNAQGKLDEAVACYRRALEMKPDFGEAHNNLGNALKAQGKLDEAVACYHRALELRPDFADAHNNLGNAFKIQERLDEAVDCYRRALELKPNYAEAHNNLGAALQGRGKLDDAVACYCRALESKPDYVEAHYNLGNAFNDQGNLDDAVVCYRRALELNPDFAEAHSNLGNSLKEQGKLGEAVACYRRTLELTPDFAEAHNNLGNTLKEQGNLDAAVACYLRSLELMPNFAEAHNNLGIVLRDQGKLDEAAACYQRALELKPNFAEAKLNLGDLHEDLGEMAEAELAFRAALKIHPAFARPRARLATLLRANLPEADRVALEARIADPELNQDSRAELSFALANVLDAHGDYDRAAVFLRQANALRLELNRGDRTNLAAGDEQFVHSAIGAFDREFFARVAGAGVDTCRPVFIVGLPRSGTTLIEQVLASHSRIYGAGELVLVQQTFDAIPTMLGRYGTPLDCVKYLDAPALRRLAAQHLERIEAIDGGRSERIVDKMPDNYLHLGLLAAMFPRAALIHCRRDLRDVAVSCWMTDFLKIRWANDPGQIASRFRQYIRAMDHWRATLPISIHEVNYEEVVADLEPVARRIVAACGLDWEPACLEFHRTQRPIRTASRTQVRQPIYTQSLARWKNYERELAEMFAALPSES